MVLAAFGLVFAFSGSWIGASYPGCKTTRTVDDGVSLLQFKRLFQRGATRSLVDPLDPWEVDYLQDDQPSFSDFSRDDTDAEATSPSAPVSEGGGSRYHPASPEPRRRQTEGSFSNDPASEGGWSPDPASPEPRRLPAEGGSTMLPGHGTVTAEAGHGIGDAADFGADLRDGMAGNSSANGSLFLNQSCTTKMDSRVSSSMLYDVAEPGTPCIFGLDPRDEGTHCIMDDGVEYGSFGWCWTDNEMSKWGSCNEFCPLSGAPKILGEKIDRLQQKVAEYEAQGTSVPAALCTTLTWEEVLDNIGSHAQCKGTMLCSAKRGDANSPLCQHSWAATGDLAHSHPCYDDVAEHWSESCIRKTCEDADECGGYVKSEESSEVYWLLGTDIAFDAASLNLQCWAKTWKGCVEDNEPTDHQTESTPSPTAYAFQPHAPPTSVTTTTTSTALTTAIATASNITTTTTTTNMSTMLTTTAVGPAGSLATEDATAPVTVSTTMATSRAAVRTPATWAPTTVTTTASTTMITTIGSSTVPTTTGELFSMTTAPPSTTGELFSATTAPPTQPPNENKLGTPAPTPHPELHTLRPGMDTRHEESSPDFVESIGDFGMED